MNAKVPVTVLTGFLGAGKTTFGSGPAKKARRVIKCR